MYCFIYRILQIKTVAQCMNNMSLLNVVVINSVFMMSIDKHVHFEMGIASGQMHKKQKQSYIYIYLFFPPVQDTFAENFIKLTQHGCHIH